MHRLGVFRFAELTERLPRPDESILRERTDRRGRKQRRSGGTLRRAGPGSVGAVRRQRSDRRHTRLNRRFVNCAAMQHASLHRTTLGQCPQHSRRFRFVNRLRQNRHFLALLRRPASLIRHPACLHGPDPPGCATAVGQRDHRRSPRRSHAMLQSRKGHFQIAAPKTLRPLTTPSDNIFIRRQTIQRIMGTVQRTKS